MQDRIRTETSRFPGISAQVSGDSDNALVLIHGFPATGRLWDRIAADLSAHFKVIIPDLPGVGQSDLGQPSVTIDELGQGMIELLDKLGIEKALFAGHSMGGYISLAVAEHHPHRLSGLSMIHSTTAADDEEKIATRRKAIALIEKGGKEPFIRTNVASLFSPGFKEQHEQVINNQIEESLTIPEQTLIAYYNAMIGRPDRTGLLEKLPFPIQWIMGEDDKVIPKEKSLHQSSLSYVNFVSVYENCGHMSMLEQPDMLIDDLKTFTHYCNSGKMKE